jgi:hypothetical protein
MRTACASSDFFTSLSVLAFASRDRHQRAVPERRGKMLPPLSLGGCRHPSAALALDGDAMENVNMGA